MSAAHAATVMPLSSNPMTRSARTAEQSVRGVSSAAERIAHAAERANWLAAKGDEIRRDRTTLRIGQRELAGKAGVAVGTLSAIENGLCDNDEAIQCVQMALLMEISGAARLFSAMAADALARAAKGVFA